MPKPMLKLAGRPMLSWVLDSLNLTAADTIFVGLSHEYVSPYTSRLTLNPNPKPQPSTHSERSPKPPSQALG